MSRPRKPFGVFLENGKPGDVFVRLASSDRACTSDASRYGRSITTERVAVVSGIKEAPTALAAILVRIVA